MKSVITQVKTAIISRKAVARMIFRIIFTDISINPRKIITHLNIKPRLCLLKSTAFDIIIHVKKVFIKTYGCQMNVHETEKLYSAFERENITAADCAENADIVVFNTCCVREGAETRVLGNLGQIKKLKQSKPNLIVAVCGCMTQQSKAAEMLHKRCPFINIITGTYSLGALPQMVKAVEKGEKFILDLSVNEEVPQGTNLATRSDNVNRFVNIMYGCDNFCTYCIVPYVKGRERSRRLVDVKEEVRILIENGAKEITLLGQNVNSYRDENNDFYSLLSELAGLNGDFWIKFMTSHPKDLSDDVIKLVGSEKKLANYIHLPVQSGSDDILRKMNRKYGRAEYLRKIDLIKEYIPHVGLTSDIIVGFPTETEKDFSDTLDLVKQVEYNNLFMFIYSKRNGTPAAIMDGQVPEEVKKERITRLIGLQSEISNKLAEKCIGETFEVLCDGHGKNATGKTSDDRVIVFDDGGKDYYNQFIEVQITSVKNSKLYGKIRG